MLESVRIDCSGQAKSDIVDATNVSRNMLPEIPRLEDYGVSPKTGFLPEEPPLERLPDPYYAPWENIAADLPSLIMTKRLRFLVDKIPLLTTEKLKTEAEWRRACSVLGFLCHGYVWAGDKPSDRLPKQLAEPWLEVVDHFELPAICTYAGLCLWNFKTVVPCDPEEWDLDNLATINTFTGAIDESWFYLVSTAIERQGAPALATGIEAIHACRRNDSERVVDCLQKLAESIDQINTSLARMYEFCDPHIFYFRIRPYLAGWKNMAEAGLPNGVIYGDEPVPRSYSGGSNAQSSLIQALDILLNVEHQPTGERTPPASPALAGSSKAPAALTQPQPEGSESRYPGSLSALLLRNRREAAAAKAADKEDDSDSDHEVHPAGLPAAKRNNFIERMRWYMPGEHRRFLEQLSKVAEIRDYVMANQEKCPALTLSYDACLAMLRAFRDRHIQIVSRYIILQAREAQRNKPMQQALRHGLAAASKSKRGTGGTALIPFLKQARDETGDSAAGTWGKRLLTENKNLLATLTKKRHIFSSSEEEGENPAKKAKAQTPESEEIQGLAGSWKMDNDNGSGNHW